MTERRSPHDNSARKVGSGRWLVDRSSHHAPCWMLDAGCQHTSLSPRPISSRTQHFSAQTSKGISKDAGSCCPICGAGQLSAKESKMASFSLLQIGCCTKAAPIEQIFQASPDGIGHRLAKFVYRSYVGNKPIHGCHCVLGLGIAFGTRCQNSLDRDACHEVQSDVLQLKSTM